VLGDKGIQDNAQLGLLEQSFLRDPLSTQISFDSGHLGDHFGCIIRQLPGLAKDLGEIDALHRDASLFEELFAIAYRDKGRRARTHLSKARTTQAVHHATNRTKGLQVLPKALRLWIHRMERGQAVLYAVLRHVVAGRHLPAKAITPPVDVHLGEIVGRRLHQHRHIQP